MNETHVTPIQILNRKKKVIGQVNRSLKELGRKVGLNTTLTTYVGRHTYATTLYRDNVPFGVISQALAHKNPETTAKYLARFEDSALEEANSNLL